MIELEEMDVPVGEGFQFSILGPHDAGVGQLLAHLRAHAEVEVARRYLEPNSHRRGWLLTGDEVAGRLVCSEDRGVGEPYDVVVDGRTLSWEDLGRALQPFEFQVSENTDLFVWLSEAPDPKTSVDAVGAERVVVGNLKSMLGNQNYEVPANVPTDRIRSIVIRCEPVAIVYAAASLARQ